MKYKIGMVLSGTITGLQPYGAFVSLDEETQGLIHVSEVQAGFTKNIHGLLTVGQKVTVQVIDVDEYSQKISLSLCYQRQNSGCADYDSAFGLRAPPPATSSAHQ